MKPLDYIATLNTLTSIYSQLPHTSGQSHSIEAYPAVFANLDTLDIGWRKTPRFLIDGTDNNPIQPACG
jgi:hypothetical protein